MSRFDRLEIEPSRAKSQAAPAPRQEEIDDQNWLKKAKIEREKGRHENALRLYSRALEWDKTQVSGWVGQVQMLIALLEYPEAELWARKSLELFKNNPDLLAGRSQALCRIGDFPQAQVISDLALNQQGSSSYPWIARGELILARGQKNEAYCFDKAKQISADFLTLLDIAAVYEHYRHASQALIWTRLAVERAPDQAHGWFCQGRCEAALGLNRPAAISFERCRQLSPNHLEARQALERVRQGGGLRGNVRRWLGF